MYDTTKACLGFLWAQDEHRRSGGRQNWTWAFVCGKTWHVVWDVSGYSVPLWTCKTFLGWLCRYSRPVIVLFCLCGVAHFSIFYRSFTGYFIRLMFWLLYFSSLDDLYLLSCLRFEDLLMGTNQTFDGSAHFFRAMCSYSIRHHRISFRTRRFCFD